MRLRSDFWVAAHIRRCNSEGASAVLRRRGALEAGAIFVVVDRLDGTVALYGPAPQSQMLEGLPERLFVRMHKDATLASAQAEQRLDKQLAYDPDAWVIEIEDRHGRSFLDMARNIDG